MKITNICNRLLRSIIIFVFIIGNVVAVIAMQQASSSDVVMSENPSNNNNNNAEQPQNCSDLRNQLMVGLSSNHPEMIIDAMDKFFDFIPLAYKVDASEAFYHSLLYVFFLSTGYDVQAERPSGDGYSDMMVIPANQSRYYIFEYKISDNRQKTPLLRKEHNQQVMINGMRQIFENDYYGMLHQHGKPFTFFSTFFSSVKWLDKNIVKEKTIDDGFGNISSLVLGVSRLPVTLKLTNIKASNEIPIQIPFQAVPQSGSGVNVKHTEYMQYITLNNFEEMLVKKLDNFDNELSLRGDDEEHVNLKNIREALEACEVPKFLKNIDCLLKSIPCKLRGTSINYYKALLLAIFYAAGLNVELKSNHFLIKASDKTYRIWSEFSSGKAPDTIKDEMERKFRDFVNSFEVKDEVFIGLSVNQPVKSSGVKRKMGASSTYNKTKTQKIEKSDRMSLSTDTEEGTPSIPKVSLHAKGTSKRELRGYALHYSGENFFCLDENKTPYVLSGTQTSLQPSSPITPQKPHQSTASVFRGTPKKLEFNEEKTGSGD